MSTHAWPDLEFIRFLAMICWWYPKLLGTNVLRQQFTQDYNIFCWSGSVCGPAFRLLRQAAQWGSAFCSAMFRPISLSRITSISAFHLLFHSISNSDEKDTVNIDDDVVGV